MLRQRLFDGPVVLKTARGEWKIFHKEQPFKVSRSVDHNRGGATATATAAVANAGFVFVVDSPNRVIDDAVGTSLPGHGVLGQSKPLVRSLRVHHCHRIKVHGRGDVLGKLSQRVKRWQR